MILSFVFHILDTVFCIPYHICMFTEISFFQFLDGKEKHLQPIDSSLFLFASIFKDEKTKSIFVNVQNAEKD